MPEMVRSNYFSHAHAVVSAGADGSLRMRSSIELGPYGRSILDFLDAWARLAPDHPMLGERDLGGSWRTISYGQMRQRAGSIARSLLKDHQPGRCVAILSGNSIGHACMMFGAMLAGMPCAPLSPWYAAHPQGLDKLRHALALLNPAVVFHEDAAVLESCRKLFAQGSACVHNTEGAAGVSLTDLARQDAPAEKMDAAASVDPDSIAKYLFTSGSTGMPKAVANTHRMMMANQKGAALLFGHPEHTPFVLVDWLPWHHTFGGNQIFNTNLRLGGVLYIDAGRPTASGFSTTLENLRDHAPTRYFNVPVGYDMLAAALEQDAVLADRFFSRLYSMACGGAGLTQSTFERLRALALRHAHAEISITGSLGATECAPAICAVHWHARDCRSMGLPYPGVTLKLLADGDAYRLSVKGPTVFPGYLLETGALDNRRDIEGYFETGDRVAFVDTKQPDLGLQFAGRVADSFKLQTGTWVQSGSLQSGLLSHLRPLVSHAVVTGEGNATLGLLLWKTASASQGAGIWNPDDAKALEARLHEWNRQNDGSSARIASAMLMNEPLSIADGEITEKGTVNQRAVWRRRASSITWLNDPGVGVNLPHAHEATPWHFINCTESAHV